MKFKFDDKLEETTRVGDTTLKMVTSNTIKTDGFIKKAIGNETNRRYVVMFPKGMARTISAAYPEKQVFTNPYRMEIILTEEEINQTRMRKGKLVAIGD